MDLDKVVGRFVMFVATGCIALVAVTVVALAAPSVRAQLGIGSSSTTSYPAGGRIDLPTSIYTSAPRTLVLFARSDCAACLSAKPFFRTIAERLTGGGLQMRVVMDAVSEVGRTDALEYVRSLGLGPTALETIDLGATRIKRVPTLILVDQSGTVLSDWEPPLPQEDVFRALLSVQPAR